MGGLNRDDRIVAGLLGWAGTSMRILPWRRGAGAWGILVSEVMLQQTTLARVEQKFTAFIDRFPDPASLAGAPLAEALTLWQGLGYPRRCRNLREAAGRIVADHAGSVPSTLPHLLALPGVGGYTARAVMSFAHGACVGVVDTNVSRVLSRLEGRPMRARELQDRADSLVPDDSSWVWNQVMMDFGATQCAARRPGCASCPVRGECRWAGSRGEDPAPASAGASRPQGRFAGSDRQARGKAIAALVSGTRDRSDVVEAMGLGCDGARADRLLDSLVSEGLLVAEGARLRLP